MSTANEHNLWAALKRVMECLQTFNIKLPDPIMSTAQKALDDFEYQEGYKK